MERVAAIVLFGAFALPAHGDFLYVCSPRRDYIEIAADYYRNLEPVPASAETIPTLDKNPSEATVRRCHLSSGIYTVLFAARGTGEPPAAADGRNRTLDVEIRHESDIVLPRTAVGKCDIPYSEDGICGDIGAVEIEVSGRTGRAQLLRLVTY